MIKTKHFSVAVLCVGAFAAGSLAQQSADRYHKNHPNLAIAAQLAQESANHIAVAQKNNEYDFGGHAIQAREHLAEANKQLGLAQQFISQHPEKEVKK